MYIVHANVFHRIQYICLLLFYSVVFQSCKFQSLRRTDRGTANIHREFGEAAAT